MSFLVGYLVFAQTWKDPTAAPPGANVPAPINIGNIGQWKLGTGAAGENPAIGVSSTASPPFALTAGVIAANTFYDANNNSYYLDPANTGYSAILAGNVGIGTPSPEAKLEVVGGAIKATGGLIIETRTSDPASPVNGQIWLRTDL